MIHVSVCASEVLPVTRLQQTRKNAQERAEEAEHAFDGSLSSELMHFIMSRYRSVQLQRRRRRERGESVESSSSGEDGMEDLGSDDEPDEEGGGVVGCRTS